MIHHLEVVGAPRTKKTHNLRRTGNGGAPRHAAGSRLSDRTAIAMGEPPEIAQLERPDWWATEPAVGRLADGVSGRVGRLRAYGNAIVPQVAAAFVSAYLECKNVNTDVDEKSDFGTIPYVPSTTVSAQTGDEMPHNQAQNTATDRNGE